MKKSVNNRIKIILKIFIYILLIYIVLLYMSYIFLPNETVKHYYRKNVDIYFVGASGFQTGIIPMQIYDQI